MRMLFFVQELLEQRIDFVAAIGRMSQCPATVIDFVVRDRTVNIKNPHASHNDDNERFVGL